VSLSIGAGETVGLIGESGSGKSTLGRLILGLLKPDHGQVRFEGKSLLDKSPAQLRELRSQLQVVFQEPYESLNPRLKVAAIVAEPLIVQRTMTADDRRRRVNDVLARVGLSEAIGKLYPGELSGGQQQRVGVARAIVGKPRLVVLDEPTASLDRTIRRQVTDLLTDLQRDLNLSYLLITHDIESVRRMAARSLVMYRGHLVEEGATREILSNPAHPYTRALVSSELPAAVGKRPEQYRLKPRTATTSAQQPGCPLVPICPLAVAECSGRMPPMLVVAADHLAACIRWRDVLESRVGGPRDDVRTTQSEMTT
jgi:oligopeptide/dipeptide ABC transporter ATP-binding protein